MQWIVTPLSKHFEQREFKYDTHTLQFAVLLNTNYNCIKAWTQPRLSTREQVIHYPEQKMSAVYHTHLSGNLIIAV